MRLLCPECRRLEEPTDEEREVLGDKTPEKLYHAVGCEHCNGSGYVGRIAIHEILIVDKHIREMITAHSSADEIESYAINEQKMKTLRTAATEMVLKGMTTVDELNRVAYGTD
jgi:type IV pilus assembly protein PilB